MTGSGGYNVSITCQRCGRKFYGLSEHSIKRARDAAEDKIRKHGRECREFGLEETQPIKIGH